VIQLKYDMVPLMKSKLYKVNSNGSNIFCSILIFFCVFCSRNMMNMMNCKIKTHTETTKDFYSIRFSFVTVKMPLS
jgi:hypothetical protein